MFFVLKKSPLCYTEKVQVNDKRLFTLIESERMICNSLARFGHLMCLHKQNKKTAKRNESKYKCMCECMSLKDTCASVQ